MTSYADAVAALPLEPYQVAKKPNQMNNPNQVLHVWVQCWNAEWIYARCPFCKDTHRHPFIDYKRLRYTCNHTPSAPREYELFFPFDARTGDAWYSIDGQQALFTTGAFSRVFTPTEDLKRRVVRFYERNLARQRKWSQAAEHPHPTAQRNNLFDGAVLAVWQGDVNHVQQYLESTDVADIFLRGIDDTGNRLTLGQTVLHIAACKGNTEMLDLLLSKNTDPNACDVTGRTPLMEAAHWGQVQSVHRLLAHGAMPNRICLHKGYGLKAVDFAQLPRGDDADLNLRLRNIVPLLMDPHTETVTGAITNPRLLTTSIPEELTYITAGIMARVQLPVVILTKGRYFLTGNIEYIEASRISITGFPEGPEGVECVHAAQQLARHFIYHHQFPKLIHPELHELLPGMEGLQSLKNIQPPFRVRRANIVVVTPICPDCSQFIDEINNEYDLGLRVFYIPF